MSVSQLSTWLPVWRGSGLSELIVFTTFPLSEVSPLAWLWPSPGGQKSHVSHHFPPQRLQEGVRVDQRETQFHCRSQRQYGASRILWRICFWLRDIFSSPSVLPPCPNVLWQAMKRLRMGLPKPVTSCRKHASFSSPTCIPCHRTVGLLDILMGLVGLGVFSQVDLSRAVR